MTTYYIYVANNSAKVQTFFLFNELPGMDGVTKAYSNVYAAGRPRQPDGSIQQFAVTTDAFAVCGYQQINKNVVISGTDNTPMNLDGTDPDEANIVVVDGGPGFVASTGGAQSGSFNITVKPYDEGTYRKLYLSKSLDHEFGSRPKVLTDISQLMFGAVTANWEQSATLGLRQMIPTEASDPPQASRLSHAGRPTRALPIS